MIGFASQWWIRTHRPGWFKKYNYLLSAALDGGSQVIIFILVRASIKIPIMRTDMDDSGSPLRCSVPVARPSTSLIGGATLTPPRFP